MAETARQEIPLTFGGKPYRVRPTFQNIVNLEGALNQSARSVGMKAFASGTPSAERGLQPEIALTELAVALFWILQGQEGAPKSVEAVGEILMEEGYTDLLLPVGQYLTRAQRGHKQHEKESEEAERKVKEAGEAGAAKGPIQTVE